MSSSELISWISLHDDYIEPLIPFEQTIRHVPELRLLYEPETERVGVRVGIKQATRWVRSDGLRYLSIRRVVFDGQHYLEVSVAERDLYLPMYQLASDINARIQAGQGDGAGALQSALNGFEMVVAKFAQPTRQAVIGLFGELWILRGLLKERRANVRSWTGAGKEMHDFRLAGFELEVKTTTANTREHVIHGINQLKPTEGCVLHIVSIQLGSAGTSEGTSVADLCAELTSELASSPMDLVEFAKQLDSFGFSKESSECAVKYKLLSNPTVIEIGSDIQGVYSTDLSGLLGQELGARTRELTFRINLEGLGRAYNPKHYGVAHE